MIWRRVFTLVLATGWVLPHLAPATQPSELERIAYLAMTDDFWQVFTMRPDGSQVRQMTRSPYEKSHVAWFPDGRRLLVCGVDGRLVEIDLESGEERAVPLPVEGTHDAVVAPDGSRIAFSANMADSKDDNEIWSMKVDGTDVRKHTEMDWLQHEPAWSPDSRWIYFVSGEGKQSHDVWRLSPASGTREQLTAGQLYHFGPTLALDGSLAFSSNRSGNYEIWIEEKGGAARALTNDPSLDGAPTWSPDGRALAFHSSRSGALQVWRVPRAGGEAVQLTQHADGARDPEWWGPDFGARR